MIALTRKNVLSLSIPERIRLVPDIRDTIAEVPEEIDLSDEQKGELDRQLKAYQRNPSEGSPRSLVKNGSVTIPVFHARRDTAHRQDSTSQEP